MNLSVERSGYGQFRCPRRRRGSPRSGEEVSAAKGTWFEGHLIPITTSIRLMFSWTENLSYAGARRNCPQDTGNLSDTTIADWYNYCRELITYKFLDDQDRHGLIGGPGKIVQIDEAKFGRRKYNRGRHVEGHWVIGMIEDGSVDFRLEICPDNERSAEILIPLILKHVAIGTTIRTDEWKGYTQLPRYGYVHQTVNHSREFVTEEGVHTNRVESMWRPMRAFFQGRLISDDVFADHLVEYQWRRQCRLRRIEKFESLLGYIRDEYRVAGYQ